MLIVAQNIKAQNKIIIPTNIQFVDTQLPEYAGILPGDTLLIEAGLKEFLIFSNIHGTPEKPVVFINHGGRVIFESDKSFGIDIRNCSNVKLTGTGDNDEKYGFYVRRLFHDSSVGIGVGYKTTDFEIENIEIANVSFAGILAKTDPTCKDISAGRGIFVQKNSLLHDLYIHDVNGEGIYLGSSKFIEGYYLSECDTTIFSHVLEGVRVYNNIIENSGLDGLQISSAVNDCQVYNNIIRNDSRLENNFQMSGIIIGGGSKCDCYNNIISDGKGTGILYFGSRGSKIFNNLIINPGKTFLPEEFNMRQHGIYIDDRSYGMTGQLYIYNNTIISPKTNGIAIAEDVNHLNYIKNNIIIDPGAFGTDQVSFEQACINPFSTGIKIEKSHNFLAGQPEMAEFVDHQNYDYHLQQESPLIDAGIDLSTNGISFDLEYRTRPIGESFDIGAYESDWSSSVSDTSVIELFRCYPNPGRSNITFNYVLNNPKNINLYLTDNIGRLVKVFVKDVVQEGEQKVEYDLSDLSDEVYFCILEANGERVVRQLIVIN